MMKPILQTILLLIAFFLSAFGYALAQEKKSLLYVDINSSSSSTVYETWDQRVGIQYTDQMGHSQALPLTIFDGSKKKVAEVTLAKTKGLNHFILNLNELKIASAIGKTYSFRLLAENGKLFEFLVKIVPPSEKQPPVVALSFNPVQLSCAAGSSQLIEFLGDVTSAVLPYKASWYVLNEARSSLLYQPRQETITRQNTISSINVDKTPNYYVTLFVTDACGRTSQKTVFVKCQNGTKNISTLNIEPLDKASLDKLNGIIN
jgi:hypothetical protein